MRASRTILRPELFMIVGCAGMFCAVQQAMAQCQGGSAIGFNGVSTVEGKPFRARQITTIVSYRGDGTKHVQVVKANLFRDSKGRVRVERFMDGTEDPPKNVPVDILVYDNCGTSLSLLPSRRSGKITTMSFPAKRPAPPFCEEIDPEDPPNPGPPGKFENLGHRFIDGIEIRGERTSFFASAGEKLSGTAPIRITEDWCSQALDTPIVHYSLTDKPKLEVRTEVRDIRQVEPDSELFEIPEGYKITKDDRNAQTLNMQLDFSRPNPQ